MYNAGAKAAGRRLFSGLSRVRAARMFLPDLPGLRRRERERLRGGKTGMHPAL